MPHACDAHELHGGLSKHAFGAASGRAAEREQAANLAREQGAYLVVLECVAPEPVVRKRLERRQQQEGEASDGRWEIYQRQLQVFEPLVEVEAGSRIVVDNSVPKEVAMPRLLRAVFSRWLAS